MFQINILVGSILSVRGPILLFSNQPFHLDFVFEGKQVFLAIFGVAEVTPFSFAQNASGTLNDLE